MNKTLTISIAAYNVEQYLSNTLDSFICSKDVMDAIEVIIVSDGSKDNTAQIAKEYVDRYPNSFILIEKENGGYGSTINSSLQIARGKYYRTVDGDDWVDTKGFEKYVRKLKDIDSDLIITKFCTVMDDDSKATQEITHGLLFDEKVMDFDTIIQNELSDFLSMHCLTFRTELLLEHNISITEHCFYTDSELVMKPIQYINTAVKINEIVYMYRIGREGQSVSIPSRMKHIDQSILVNLKKAQLLESVVSNPNVSKPKKDYLYKAIVQDVAEHYYYLLAINEKIQSLTELANFDSLLKDGTPYVYNEVLKTNRGRIIRSLRTAGFRSFSFMVLPYRWKILSQLKHRSK